MRPIINLILTVATALALFWLFDLGSRLSELQLFIAMLAVGMLSSAFWYYVMDRIAP